MKLTVAGNPAAPAEYESRQLVSDLFHQLSQPLTTLCCALELALLQTPTREEYGKVVNDALRQAEKASALATAIHELLDAGHAGENCEVLNLGRAVEDAVGDLLPVAESAGVKMACIPQPACPVWFDARRLRQGLFHLLGFLISAGVEGSIVQIALKARAAEPELGLTVSGAGISNGTSAIAPDEELWQRLGLGISRSIFERAGGTFGVEHGPGSLTVRLRFLRKAR